MNKTMKSKYTNFQKTPATVPRPILKSSDVLLASLMLFIVLGDLLAMALAMFFNLRGKIIMSVLHVFCAAVFAFPLAWYVDSFNNKLLFVRAGSGFLLLCCSAFNVFMWLEPVDSSWVDLLGKCILIGHFPFRVITISLFMDHIQFQMEGTDRGKYIFTEMCVSGLVLAIQATILLLVQTYKGIRALNITIATSTLIFSVIRCAIVLSVSSKRTFTPNLKHNLAFSTCDYTMDKFMTILKRIVRRRSPKRIFSNEVKLNVTRFWKLMILVIFFIPLGLIHLLMVATINCTVDDMTTDSLYIVKSSSIYFFYISAVVFPVYYLLIAPRLKNSRCLSTDLQHVIAGELMAFISILVCLFLHTFITSGTLQIPTEGYAQIRIFNMLGAELSMETDNEKTPVQPFSFSTYSRLTNTHVDTTVAVNNEEYNIHEKASIVGFNKQSVSYLVDRRGIRLIGVENLPVNKSGRTRGKQPIVYFLSLVSTFEAVLKSDKRVMEVNTTNITLVPITLPSGMYSVSMKKNGSLRLMYKSWHFAPDCTYIMFFFCHIGKENVRIFTLIGPRVLRAEWILPTLFLFAVGTTIEIYYLQRFLLYQCPPAFRTILIVFFHFLMIIKFHFVFRGNPPHIINICATGAIRSLAFVHLILITLFVFAVIKYVPYVFIEFET